jgi:citrate lyase subunit beta/citryl-CoA lyase
MSAAREMRARRSCHAVPGSNPRFLEKAQGLESDQVFLDIEDSVAPIAKADARKNIVEVLNTGEWGNRVRTVRVNDWTTQWTYKDVIEVVEGAGANLDCIMLPKVQTPDQVKALDVLLTQIETTMGYEVGRIGIEAQIENALGLINVDDIATASPRVETIIFGPADFMASINMKSLVVGEQPPGYDVGDAYHYILMRLLMAARAHDKQVIDGPYLQIKDLDGFKRVAGRPPSASTASGPCTPRRSRWPTRCTPPCRRTTTTPRTSSMPTSTTRPSRAVRRARSCSATR